MLIIERRATANHAEYGPILAHMGLFRRNEVEKWANIGAWGRRMGTELLGNVAEIQNFPTCYQDLSMEKPATSRRRGVHLHTLVDR